MELTEAAPLPQPDALAARAGGRRSASWAGVRPYLLLALACLAVGAGSYLLVLRAQLQGSDEAALRRLEFSTASLEATLARNEALPGLLALEGKLGAALAGEPGARVAANLYLEAAADQAGVSAAYLMDHQGLTIAASNWNRAVTFLGQNYAFRPYVQQALAGHMGRFHGVGATSGEPGYFLATRLHAGTGATGVVAVKASLEEFERAMVQGADPVALVDENGVVILSSVPAWRYRTLQPLDATARARLATTRQYGGSALQPIDGSGALTPELRHVALRIDGRRGHYALVRQPVGRLGWSMILLADEAGSRWTALVAAVAAAALAACALGLHLHLRVKREQREQVRRAEAALRAASDELEQRIARRTAELSDANTQLASRVEELKKTESILRATTDAAVQAGKLTVLGQMSAGMTHELNQPLGALHTLSDNAVRLLDTGRVEEVRENLHLIARLTARMGHIVRQLKMFARKETGSLQPVPLAPAIDSALMLVAPRTREVGADVQVTPLPEGLAVRADLVRLEQVLVNLLRNALDAVAGRGQRQVRVQVESDAATVVIRVSDSGAGIAAEVLPRLFEPFFTTKPAGEGLGLGLALSQAIVQGFGGRLAARAHAEGGAEFELTLERA